MQNLLRAESVIGESVIAERKRRSRTSEASERALPHKQELVTRNSDKNTTGVNEGTTRRTQNSTSTQGTAEATLRHAKCFNYSQKVHLAKDCTAPKKKNSTHRITDDCQEEWICSVASKDHTLDNVTDSTKVPRRGPTYKVKVNVEGVQTRVLLDHGAQVSLVHRQFLSHI